MLVVCTVAIYSLLSVGTAADVWVGVTLIVMFRVTAGGGGFSDSVHILLSCFVCKCTLKAAAWSCIGLSR